MSRRNIKIQYNKQGENNGNITEQSTEDKEQADTKA